MLREQVLSSWKNYKDKVFKLKKVINVLSQSSDSLPMFPIGLTDCRSKLELWTSYEWQEKLEKAKRKIAELETPEVIMDLWLNCSSSLDMFKELTNGWKKEKDSYARFKDNSNSSGPIIEDPNDW